MSKTRKIVTIVLLSLTALTTIFIFVNAFLPSDISSSISTTFSDTIIRIFIKPENDEKFYHFVRKSIGHFLLNGINAGLALLTLFTYFKYKKEHRGYLLVPAFTYGVVVAGLSELAQLTADGRSAQWSDFGINTLGCITSVVLIGLVYAIKFFVEKKKRCK